MKSSFSRSFYTGALILLVSLVMVGVSYQQLVKDYLTDTTFSRPVSYTHLTLPTKA